MIEMISMTNPDIQSFERPLLEEEVQDFGKLSLQDNFFNFGLYLYNDHSDEFYEIPEHFGRFMARTEYFENHEEIELMTETVPCKDNTFLDLTV